VSQSQANAWSSVAATRIGVVGGYGFLLLGLTDSMLGVAWPTIRQAFGEPLTALSLLLVASALGYVATSAPSGYLLNRFGAVPILAVASLTAGFACVLVAAAPDLWMLAAAALLLGAASGSVDAGLNTVVANGGPLRLLNAIHGAYGVGTVVGPILVTLAIVWASSWRLPYACLIGAEVLCSLGWWTARGSIDAVWSGSALQAGNALQDCSVHGKAKRARAVQASAERPADSLGQRSTRLRAGVAMAVSVALVQAGAQFSAGQWAASYLRGVTGLHIASAGLAVAGYWGVFAATLLALALPSRQIATERMIPIGCIVALAGAGLLWLGHSAAVSITAFIIIGAGLAPVFPTLLSMTAGRFGAPLARHVIGWQLAAAGAGGQCLSALTGILLGRFDLLALGPILMVLILMTLAGSLLLHRLTPLAD
jgi:fucose permease